MTDRDKAHEKEINLPMEGNESELGSWKSWARWIISEIKELNANHDKLVKEIIALKDVRISNLEKDLVKTQEALKNKAGVWGLFGGAIPVVVMILLFLLYEILKN